MCCDFTTEVKGNCTVHKGVERVEHRLGNYDRLVRGEYDAMRR
jgi:hypothetical protein